MLTHGLYNGCSYVQVPQPCGGRIGARSARDKETKGAISLSEVDIAIVAVVVHVVIAVVVVTAASWS